MRVKGQATQWTQEEIDACAALANEGLYCGEIARRIGRGKTNVRKYMKQIGVELRIRVQPGRASPVPFECHSDEPITLPHVSIQTASTLYLDSALARRARIGEAA